MEIKWMLAILGCLFFHFPSTSGELKLIQVVFRHGNRAPVAAGPIYPNDPYYNKTYNPDGPGGLTNEGKLLVFRLGEFLRRRYGKFLGPTYSNRIIRFRADEVDRIMMTVELVAAGLFPPEGKQRWNHRLNWQPVPVWTVPLDTDILYNGIFCTNHKKWREEVEKNDPALLAHQKKYKELYEYVSKHAGSEITQQSSFYIRQQLYAERDLGLTLPKWTEEVFPDAELDEVAIFDFIIQSYTQPMKQLLGGIWIREWLDHVDTFLNRTETVKRKAYMYGAHELNIAPILIALKCFDNQIPSYASTVMFELHEIRGQLFVQVLHRHWEKLRVLKIPGCDGKMCSLKRFREIVAPVIPKDIVALCGDMVLQIPS